MRPEDVKDGCYTLIEPIDNPHPDGRKRDWHCQKTLPKGRYIACVYDDPNLLDSGTTLRTIDLAWTGGHNVYGSMSMCLRMHRDGTVTRTGANNARVEALINHMVSDDSLTGALSFAAKEQYVSPAVLLLYLVESGVVSDDAVRIAIKAIHERDKARHDAEEAERNLKAAKAKLSEAS